MNDEELDAWEEALEILSDPETMQAIGEANEELASGQTFTFEQVFGHEQPDPPQ